MAGESLSPEEAEQVEELVLHFAENRESFTLLLESLRLVVDSPVLRDLYHSARWRVKDPDHLRRKLRLKLLEAKSTDKVFDLTIENLFERITDLAGIRLL